MTIHSNEQPLQKALFQAAKIGNINLIRDFIKAGADPFIHDEAGRNAISYAIAANPAGATALIMELDKGMGGGDKK